MPVSSPSEFPPHRGNGSIIGLESGKNATGSNVFLAGASAGNNSTINNLIVIGGAASGGAGLTDVKLAGSIFVGSSLFNALKGSLGVIASASMIVIGSNVAPNIVNAESSILIGQNMIPNTSGISGSEFQKNVLIGHNIGAGFGVGSSSTFFNMVIIGIGAQSNDTAGSNNSVVIGSNAFTGGNLFGCQGSVFIGDSAGAGTQVNQVVCIGQNSSIVGTGTIQQAVIMGPQASGGQGCTALGYDTVITVGSHNCVAIGAGGLIPGTTGYGNSFLLGTSGSLVGGGGTILQGRFDLGTLCVGNAGTPTANFGLAGMTNTLSIMNGTPASAVNPTGGGYLYVIGGILHWIDSAGVDTTLSSPAAPATGASTATFVATNKPGATTGAGPVAWENRVINGVSYQSPLWAT